MPPSSVDRITLYERVWETPMSKLAPTLGLSGPGLKKACVRLGVPTPPRGYWAQLRNGHQVRIPLLPPPAPGAPTSLSIYEPRPEVPPQKRDPKAPRPSAPVVTVPQTLQGAHALVVEAKRTLPASYKDAYGRTQPGRGGLSIRVAPANVPRALLLMHAVLGEVTRRGYRLSVPPDTGRRFDGCMGFEVDGEIVPFGVFEKVRREELSEKERKNTWDPRYRFYPSGTLAIGVGEADSSKYRRQWLDDGRAPLEEQLGDFFVTIPVEAQRQKQARQEREAWHRKWAAEREAEHARAEANARERARLQELEGQAEAWVKSQHLRAFIEAAEARAASLTLSPEERQAFEAWASWARAHSFQLDPLARGLPDTGPVKTSS